MLTRTRKAFTLLELMVAFIIMAILTAVAVPSLANLVGTDKQAGVNASAIATADSSSLSQFSGGNIALITDYNFTAGDGTVYSGFTNVPGQAAELFTNTYGTAYVCYVDAGATPTIATSATAC